nr:type IV fimbrial assembly protein PilB [uncultured bacterium]
MALDVYKDWLGIPEGDRPPDHYQLLRLVRFEDDTQKVQAHYRKLNAHVRKYASGQYSIQSQELLNELAKVMLCLTDPDRKRTYDESLGREFEEPADGFRTVPIEEVMRKDGTLTSAQVKEVLSFAELRGLSFRDAVVQMKLVDPDTAARALAVSLRSPYVDLNETVPDVTVLETLPRKVARRYSIIPLFVDDGMVLVACIDEPPHELLEELQLRYEMPAKAVIATPLAINQALAKYFVARDDDSAAPTKSGDPKKKDKKAPAKTEKKSKEETPSKRMAQSSSGDADQRKMMGYLIMIWAAIGSVLFDNYVIKPFFFPNYSLFIFFLTSPIVVPLSILYVLKIHWK